jgi:hypothetical protein
MIRVKRCKKPGTLHRVRPWDFGATPGGKASLCYPARERTEGPDVCRKQVFAPRSVFGFGAAILEAQMTNALTS